jgi:hypothetical protein
MRKANYVCTICSQTFTRKWRGKTHSINLHSGSAEIVRFVDYIVGRLDGQYFAGDPSLYRSKKSDFSSHENNSTVFDRERVFKINEEKSAVRDRISENSADFSQFQSVTQREIQKNEDPIRKDSLSDIIEESERVTIKTANLKKILGRYGPPEPLWIWHWMRSLNGLNSRNPKTTFWDHKSDQFKGSSTKNSPYSQTFSPNVSFLLSKKLLIDAIPTAINNAAS